MPELQLYKNSVYLWSYNPSLPLAIVFALLFALLSLLHTHVMICKKLWFTLPFVIGGFCEILGYICRALATNNTGSLTPFLLQSIFLLLPPVLFAASLYMVYARIVRAVHGEPHSPISLRWCTRFFVLGDWFCLNIQSSGAGLLANPKHTRIGDGIIVAGLGLQCVIFVGFMYCCVVFHVRFRKAGMEASVPWQGVLGGLYVSSVLVLVRNGFRLVEYVMGKGSYLFEHEWPIYVFDGALMVGVMVVFLVWNTSQLQTGGGEDMIELAGEEGSREQSREKEVSGSVMPGFGGQR